VIRSKRRPLVPPVPPSLPPGRIVNLPDRGETFIRDTGPVDGAGPVILLLHGWTASADLNWFQAYDALAQYGRVISIDHRAHGRGLYSEEPFTLEAAADDAAALLDVLEADSAVAVGYSMGGPVACLLRRRHPDKVDGLVLCATALEWRASVRERVVWRVMRRAQLLFKLGPPRSLMERYLRDAIDRCPDIEDVRGWLIGELRRGDPIGTHQAGLALGAYDARPWAASLGAPTSVVVTTKDRLVPKRKQRQLAKAIPGAHVVELAGDHDAALVLPVEFRSALADALGSVLARMGRADRAEAEAARIA
jgi:pimeloyl-ACP methyl ester carboxylesterase